MTERIINDSANWPGRARKKGEGTMQTAHRFRLNEPSVVHETIDGEAVIINLESGTYYSLNRAGAELWEGLAAGASVDDLLAFFGERYEASPAAIAQEVTRLLDELQLEQLIVPDEQTGSSTPMLQLEGAAKQPFELGRLEKFSDVTELLLLDPVHDVDEPGWPIQKAAG